MKKKLFPMMALLLSISVFAGNRDTAFRAYLYNNEYEVYMYINFYDQNVRVPGQDLYGDLPGYLGKKHNSFCWVIPACKVVSDREAEFQFINDFGSEDLTATLTRKNDSIYILKQKSGSTLKIPHKGKWRKLPKELELKRRK